MNGTSKKPRRAFSLGKGFIVYLILLVFAVIFTQALESPVSIVFLWFAILLPFAMLIVAFASRNAVTVFLRADERTAEKNEEVPYEFIIINNSVLPLPYVEAYVSVPSATGVRSDEKRLMIPILPKGRYHFSDKVTFKYRGKYKIGVGDVYVTDVLGFYCIKKEINTYEEIFVMPRKRFLDRDNTNAPSDLPSDSNVTVRGIESSESNRIREYRAGDSLKHVHWKLSSKMSELQVNEYQPNAGKNVYVFCDYSVLPSERDAYEPTNPKKVKKTKKKRKVKLKLAKRADSNKMSTEDKIGAARASAASRAEAAAALEAARRELERESVTEPSYDAIQTVTDAAETQVTFTNELPSEQYYRTATQIRPEFLDDMNAFIADGTSEIAIGAVMRELEAGSSVTLMWFDTRTEMGFASYPITTYADLELVFKTFATAPFADADMTVTRLPDLIENVENPTFLFATARADLSNVSDFVEASNRMGADSVEVLFFNPKERYRDPVLRAEYTEALRARFAENNIILTESRIN